MTHSNLSIHPFEEDCLKNVSANVLPDIRQFVFQVALVGDSLVFSVALWHNQRTRNHTVADLSNKLDGGFCYLFLAK
jgi:hypothetical protein